MEVLEEVRPLEEGVESTSEEGAKSTPPEETSTVGITETKEFRHELDKALGKSTISLQQQVSISKQAARAAQAESEVLKAAQAKRDEDIRFLEQKLDGLVNERFADDPEAVRGFKNTLAIELRERKAVAKEEALKLIEVEQEQRKLFYQLGDKSLELKKKYQVPSDLLETCTSVEQMETIAKAFPEVEEVKTPKETERTPKFDSTVSSGTGGKITREAQQKMSDEDWFAAQKEGKIK